LPDRLPIGQKSPSDYSPIQVKNSLKKSTSSIDFLTQQPKPQSPIDNLIKQPLAQPVSVGKEHVD